LKKAVAYRTDKEENKDIGVYKKKATNERLKRMMLPSLFK